MSISEQVNPPKKPDTLNIVCLKDLIPDMRRPRTLEDAFVELNQNKIAIQAMKSIVQSLQETVHRLQTKGELA